MEKLYVPLKDICTPAELNRKTLGRQIDSFRNVFLGGIAQFKRSCWFTKSRQYMLPERNFQILFMSDSFANAILSINLLDLRKKFSGSAAGSVNAKDIFDAHFQSSTLYSRRHYQ